jgi:hypothetical protein
MMLNAAQKKRLSDLENESINIGFERTQYTFDHTPKGIAEWDRLWARRVQIEKEIEKLKGVRDVSMAAEPVSA